MNMNKNDCPASNILYLLLSFCIALTSISTNSIAATVSVSKKKLLSPYLQSQTPSNTKKNATKSTPQKVDIDSLMNLKKSFAYNQKKFVDNIKKTDGATSKLLIYLDEDYGLLLDSLIGYNIFREFAYDTESVLNNLTEELLFSLKVEYKQTIQTELFINIQPIKPNNTALVTDQKLEPELLTYLNHPTSDSLINMEQSNQMGSNFFKKLFRINTLIYLLSLIIIFSTLKALVKFILFRIPS